MNTGIKQIPLIAQQPPEIIDTGLLAPRGICLTGKRLLVADTARNQILLYTKTENGWRQQLTLGNPGGQRAVCNNRTLQYPSGIWSNGNLLMVADAWNHRVLIWRQFPETDYQPADVVVGQPDFESDQPNINGLQTAPSAQSLYWPYGVCSNGRELWIADTGNRRVLYYSEIPGKNFAAADAVIGQTGFSEKEYNPQNATWPYSVKLGPEGQLVIADTQYYRCLYWRHWQQALQQPADVVIGQPGPEENGQNQYRLQPAAHTLNWCYDACITGNGLLVADTGNSRLLYYQQPLHTNMPAAALLGQTGFEENGEASLSMKISTSTEAHLYWPFAISYQNGLLAVADTGKSRVLIYPLNTTS